VVGGTDGVGFWVARKCLELRAEVEVFGLEHNPNLLCPQHILNVVERVDEVERFYKDKDYVFNNIGMIERNLVSDTPKATVQRFLKVNVETMFMLLQFSVRHVKRVIVNMGSRPELETNRHWSLYTLSKQTIITMTKAAAEENKQKIYAFCPSRIDTKFRDSVFPDEDVKTRLTPEEAADFVVMLFNGKNPSGSHYWYRKIYA